MELVSPYLVAIVIAWLLSHIIKYAIATGQGKRLDLTHQLFISGGMPSSHAATSVAIWMVILLKDGIGSAIFGLATLVVLVITYDAVKVRRSSGEQGEAITQLIKETKSPVKLPRSAKGHTPLEVLVGSILGATIGLVVFLATK
ncbi:MAG TPA: divergent PAP2 family protein [Candidatus Saccharimonadales bacterium]|nr:divergent PAP2 family protein [Candidatus Saccharimonadales bacterium]